MIMSAVVDPLAFGPFGIVDELAKREAIAFLTGILENGVLVDEARRGLLRQATDEASKLSTKLGERIVGLLAHLRTHKKKFVVCCKGDASPALGSPDSARTCCRLAAMMKVDALVTCSGRHQEIGKLLNGTTELVLVSEVSESKYEVLRRRMLRPEKPLDEFAPAEVEERLGRAFKYAPTVEFFDYRMVANPHRIPRFREGILYLVKIWEQWCVVGERSSRVIKLYTVGNFQTHSSGFLTGADAKERMEQIGSRIKDIVAVEFGYHVIDGNFAEKIFHARGIVAKHRAYTIDPGFDGLDEKGPKKGCLLSVSDPAADEHFRRCRNLREC
jgi:hypothetical protein